ncbi:hypothetical protein B0F90DRAFT_518647 [Multifurca ochricompacta]|uniref:Uncharacterized protein n=1 Tax=Multifurca ochricompacta TaxID=376703 RepID=A0AAD4QQW9_9AGAM|nr:hypothetical protein B0F90DRAFT_518647 [Multifurca ochricompacta]
MSYSGSSRYPSTHPHPPPPYHAVLIPPTLPPSGIPYANDWDETTSLLSIRNGRKNAKRWISHFALPLLFFLMVISLWTIVPAISTAVKFEMAEWQRVHDQMTRDIAQLFDEKRAILDEVQQLRSQRDEQRREWEREREENEQRRRGHVPFWGEARLMTAQCPKDRFRQYEARMYNLLVEDDWYRACLHEPIQIAGRTLTSPRTCVNYVRAPATSSMSL